VSIVHLEACLLGETGKIRVLGQVTSDSILEGCRDKEELLLKTKLLSVFSSIVRVEHSSDIISFAAGGNSLVVVTSVEGLKIEFSSGESVPKTKVGSSSGMVSRDRDVIRFSDDFFSGSPLAVFAERAVETDVETGLRAMDFPRVTLRSNPVVGDFYLTAVLSDLLLEHSVAVADAVTPTGEIEGGHGVQKAGCKAAKTTVTESSIEFLFTNILHLGTHISKGLGIGSFYTKILNSIGEGTPHEELSTKVVHKLGVFFPVEIKWVNNIPGLV
jgi:hypothetical protein